MKNYFIAFLVSLGWVAFVSSSDGAVSETDDVTVAGPSVEMNPQAMRQTLQAAKLEELGFNRSTEFSVTTDENGQARKKNILRYMVKDKCSEAKNWQEKLESRLPSTFFSSSISRTFARDVEDRINGRLTKYCLIGIELVYQTPLAQGIRRKPRAMWPRVRVRVRVRVRARVRIGLKAKIKY